MLLGGIGYKDMFLMRKHESDLGKGVQGKPLPEREVPSLPSLSFPKRGSENALRRWHVVRREELDKWRPSYENIRKQVKVG
jgi:hypothetical protein